MLEEKYGELSKKKNKTFATKDLSFNAKHGTLYSFDLSEDEMTQTNSATGTVTQIRRRAN